MSNVTFIGLGNMGRPMARSLARAGHVVRGFDVSPASREAASRLGLQCFETLAEALEGAEVAITMVPSGKHVRQIYTDTRGVFDLAPKSTLLIDSSTIDVETSREMHGLAEQRGFAFIDAPVTGAVPFAERGALTFMIGGDAGLVERATPTLKSMGQKLFHVGPGGSGHAMKICNNMIGGMNIVAVCEGLALGEKMGLSYQTMFDVISQGTGNCWALTNYCPVPGPVPASPANRGYEPSFSMPLMLKDMRLSQDAADSIGASTPLAACATAVYQLGVANGLGHKDCSAVFELISGRFGNEA